MKVTFTLTEENRFFLDMAAKAKVLNWLLAQEFGSDISDNQDLQDEINARKMLRYTTLLRKIENEQEMQTSKKNE